MTLMVMHASYFSVKLEKGGKVGEMNEGRQKVQTSNYKVTGMKEQHGDYR